MEDLAEHDAWLADLGRPFFELTFAQLFATLPEDTPTDPNAETMWQGLPKAA